MVPTFGTLVSEMPPPVRRDSVETLAGLIALVTVMFTMTARAPVGTVWNVLQRLGGDTGWYTPPGVFAALGADAVGFVFAPSTRQIPPVLAYDIVHLRAALSALIN